MTEEFNSEKHFLGDTGKTESAAAADIDLPFITNSRAKEDKKRHEKKVKDHTKEVIAYNKACSKVDPRMANVVLNGPYVLVKLYKHIEYTKSGLENSLQVAYTTEGGRRDSKRSPLQYRPIGVLQAVSDECSDTFKEKFKPGMVVTFPMGTDFFEAMFYLDKEKYAYNFNDAFEGLFRFPASRIENGFKSAPPVSNT